MEIRKSASSKIDNPAVQSSDKINKALIVVAGPTLIGKSTLAQSVGKALGIQCIDVDDIRKELYPDSGANTTPEEIKSRRHEVYAVAYLRAKSIINSGHSVIVIGQHVTRFTQELARDSAQEIGVPLVVITFDIDKIANLQEFLKERLRIREEKNDSTSPLRGDKAIERATDIYSVYKLIRKDDADEIIMVDPNLPRANQIANVVSGLRKALNN